MALDLNRPVQTRSGLPVRILCTDRKHDIFPVVALWSVPDGDEVLDTFTAEGRYRDNGGDSPYDLVNVPVETVKYRQVFSDGSVTLNYSSSTIGNGDTWFADRGVGWLKYTLVDDVIQDVEFIPKGE